MKLLPLSRVIAEGAIMVWAMSVDAAEIAWTNSAGGNWSVAANWSPNQVPAGADVAVITNVGSYIVTLDVNASVIGLVLGASLGEQTLFVNGPTLVVNGPANVNDRGFVSLLSGGIGGTGDISVSGLLNIFGGSFTGSGLLLIRTNGQVQINGNVTLGGRAVENTGHLIWTAGNITGGRALTNHPSGTVEVLVAGNNTFSCTQTSVNSGLIIRGSGSGTATLNFSLNNFGTLRVQSGILHLARGGDYTGSFLLSGGATLLLGNGVPQVNFDFASGSTVTGEGNVTFGEPGLSGGPVNVNGAFQVTGTTTIGSHTVNFGSGFVLSNSPLNIVGGVGNFNTGRILSPNTFAMGGGTFQGADSMSVTGAVTLSGGSLKGTGAIDVNSELSLPGDVTMFSGVLNNGVLATLTGALRLWSNSVLNNLPGATFNYSSGFFGQPGVPGRFNNAGLLRTATGGLKGVAVPFHNNGAVQIEAGTFYFSEGGTHTGAFQVATGATLAFQSGFVGARHYLTPSSQITGDGHVAFGTSADVLGTLAVAGNVSVTGGTNIFSGNYSNGGALSVSGGIAEFGVTGPITVSQLNVSGGKLSASNALHVSGAMSWTGGTLAGPGPIDAHGALTLAGSTLTLNGGTINIFGTAAWNAGSLFSGGGSVISNTPSGTFEITFDGQTFAGLGGGRNFFNAGLLRKSGGAGTARISETFVNLGNITAQSGVLAFGNSFAQTAGTIFLAGGDLAANGPLQIQAGSLAGSGTVTATVVSSSRCAPGGSAGLLAINGDYTQTSSGQLDIQLGGTSPGSTFDRLQVSGKATLNGSLNVTAINGFHPSAGQSFRILTFGSRTGEFSTFNNSTTSGFSRSFDASGLDLIASNSAPVLAVGRQGQQILITWTADAVGYVLQSTTNLPTTNWTQLASVTNHVLITPQPQPQFFRLFKP